MKLTQLPEASLRLSSRVQPVRIDDAEDETEQRYLVVEGTPAGFRWLARHLESMAGSAERHGNGCGNVVAPWDLTNRPIELEDWDALDFRCRE